MKVAIIGAGASGLASAREFRDRGHQVQVFEQGEQIGGVWAYSPQAEDDLLGINPTKRVYSSMYENLRTNLPVDLMAFKGFPFYPDLAQDNFDSDHRRFPHHTIVRQYLTRYVEAFDLEPLVSLNTEVTQVTPLGDSESTTSGWRLTFDNQRCDARRDDARRDDARRDDARPIEPRPDCDFDVVVICTGHFSVPRVPPLAGLDDFQGTLVHSHNYRSASHYAGKTVAVIGRGASGADIVQELRSQADSIYWCGFDEEASFGNVQCTPFPNRLSSSGFLIGEKEVNADVILFCTGYHYELPFIDQKLIQVDDNYVSPLYQDINLPAHPTLGLIGLNFLVVPFPLYAMQAKWFAASIDQEFSLPTQSEMLEHSRNHAREMRAEGVLQRHFHRLGEQQTRYYNELASQCGEPSLPDWFGELASEAQQTRMANPATFRDVQFKIRRQVHL